MAVFTPAVAKTAMENIRSEAAKGRLLTIQFDFESNISDISFNGNLQPVSQTLAEPLIDTRTLWVRLAGQDKCGGS